MRFALLGDHPDGLDFAGALVDSGRHEVVACSVPLDEAVVCRLGCPRRVGDVEEILADPAVEAVIVAGRPSVRPEQLRRALQSERHVACVHPADARPDIAYEAAMLQRDTGYALLPLLPEALHLAVRRLAGFIDRPAAGQMSRSPVGAFQLLGFERLSAGEVLDGTPEEGVEPAVPGWDVLRALGGELIEVSSFADGEELPPGRPVLLAGRFEKGGLFQVTLVPFQPAPAWRLTVSGTLGQAELHFPQGWNGPAFLQWTAEDGQRQEEAWPRWDPWPALVEAFEAAVARSPVPLSWQDAVRCLELDDAARRSVERRRVNLMEYQEASEEVGFKGTMTLVGCGVLWGVLLLLVVSRWVPWLGWLILPLLLLFIGLQLLRYLIPSPRQPASTPALPADERPATARGPSDAITTRSGSNQSVRPPTGG